MKHRHSVVQLGKDRTYDTVLEGRVETCYGPTPPGPLPKQKELPYGWLSWRNVEEADCTGPCTVIITMREKE